MLTEQKMFKREQMLKKKLNNKPHLIENQLRIGKQAKLLQKQIKKKPIENKVCLENQLLQQDCDIIASDIISIENSLNNSIVFFEKWVCLFQKLNAKQFEKCFSVLKKSAFDFFKKDFEVH